MPSEAPVTLQQVEQAINQLNLCPAHTVVFDLAEATPERCQQVAEQLAQQFPRLDGVLHMQHAVKTRELLCQLFCHLLATFRCRFGQIEHHSVSRAEIELIDRLFDLLKGHWRFRWHWPGSGADLCPLWRRSDPDGP